MASRSLLSLLAWEYCRPEQPGHLQNMACIGVIGCLDREESSPWVRSICSWKFSTCEMASRSLLSLVAWKYISGRYTATLVMPPQVLHCSSSMYSLRQVYAVRLAFPSNIMWALA